MPGQMFPWSCRLLYAQPTEQKLLFPNQAWENRQTSLRRLQLCEQGCSPSGSFSDTLYENSERIFFFFSGTKHHSICAICTLTHTPRDAAQLYCPCFALCCGGVLLPVPNSHAVIHAVEKRHLESCSLLLFLPHNTRNISYPLPLLTFQRAAFVLEKRCLVPSILYPATNYLKMDTSHARCLPWSCSPMAKVKGDGGAHVAEQSDAVNTPFSRTGGVAKSCCPLPGWSGHCCLGKPQCT